ncbi:MAG: cytochrome P450 [Deltaproteobacteria bacterium]|nr:cytochrome P450 [Deltaproteobacteria bacterium]
MSNPVSRIEPKMVSGAKPETGHFEEFMAHPAFFLLRAWRECGEVAAFDLAGQRNILMTGPAAQEAVFRAPDPTVLSAAAAYQYMVPVFGQGIQYGATFEMERQQTKLMATAMRAARMKGYADIIAKEVDDWMASWGDEGEIDVLAVFEALVLRTSTHSLMGSDFRAKLTDEFGGLYHELESAVSPEAMLDPHGSGDALKRRDRARARLQELVLAEVEERKQSGRQYDDMIDTFMQSTLDDGRKLPEHLIPGMVVWIMFGGFHTSSNTSAWTLLEFARNRQYMAELMAEVDGIYKSGGDLSYASLREIPLLEGFIYETLRLHPPLCTLARQVMQPFTFKEYTFNVGDTLVCSPYVAHRVPEVYPDPERFDPHRKLPDNPFAYIPFGAGMRKCVGNAFGILQVKSVMCAMLSRYDFELVGPPEDVRDVMPSLILRPTEGARVRYRRRR